MPNQGAGETKKENPEAVASGDRYEELLAQAREIMNDPEFMEEVMALTPLKRQLQQEFGSRKTNRLAFFLMTMLSKEEA